MVGLPIAAAIGALGGDPEGELEVLKHITPEQVSQAKAMLDKHKINDKQLKKLWNDMKVLSM